MSMVAPGIDDDGAVRRSRRRRRGLRFGVMAFVIGLISAAAPSANAASCYGDYCSGQDPQATGCANDAYTFASVRIPGTYSYVDLRWSPSCKTEWARVPSSWGVNAPSQLQAVQQSTG